MKKLPEDCGKDEALTRPSIYKHMKTGGFYRIVGTCINKDTDEFSILYRKWNDFGEQGVSLYCREYKSFKKAFEPYLYDSMELVPCYR